MCTINVDKSDISILLQKDRHISLLFLINLRPVVSSDFLSVKKIFTDVMSQIYFLLSLDA